MPERFKPKQLTFLSSLDFILNNLSNNYYELEKFDQSEAFLLEMLACDINDEFEAFSNQYQSLFQLAVLNYELGESEKAKNYFVQKLEVAKAFDDEYYIQDALDDLEQLNSKESSRS